MYFCLSANPLAQPPTQIKPTNPKENPKPPTHPPYDRLLLCQPSVFRSFCQSVCLSVGLHVCLSKCLYVSPSVLCLSVCLCVCLFVCPFVWAVCLGCMSDEALMMIAFQASWLTMYEKATKEQYLHSKGTSRCRDAFQKPSRLFL